MNARFVNLVDRTANIQTERLANDYFWLPNWVLDHDELRPDKFEEEIPILWHVLTGDDKGFTRKSKLLDEEGVSRKASQVSADRVDPSLMW